MLHIAVYVWISSNYILYFMSPIASRSVYNSRFPILFQLDLCLSVTSPLRILFIISIPVVHEYKTCLISEPIKSITYPWGRRLHALPRKYCAMRGRFDLRLMTKRNAAFTSISLSSTDYDLPWHTFPLSPTLLTSLSSKPDVYTLPLKWMPNIALSMQTSAVLSIVQLDPSVIEIEIYFL